ncbi:Fungal transcriptional regulatory protein [Metarhizium guizhouense ARSEF 977]|uniref:Fungal transcriptional regulatory protein n=1 Tax=Metarhizium guizhouense (strain ARSEF 977) TaxID=1276136 RepID=A0A0B4I1B0_METGA|nr:Fungal transcriptional regulatory protein [Metarhizium guizhouense ARSEF 977]
MRASHGHGFNPDPCQLPPRTVGLCLLEIYFARIYNANLLFYKPLLFQEYLEDQVPTVLLQAIFALASLFLAPRDEGEDVSPDFSELRAFAAYHSRSLLWAKAATKEAMDAVMEAPSLPAAQALVCLTLYWFGTGDSKSADLCLVLAYRFCTVWNYRRQISEGAQSSDTSLESELRRRCFWACWASMCIVAEPEPIFKDAWSEAALLPLPSVISNRPSGWQVTIGEYMDSKWSSISKFNQLEPGKDAPPSAGLIKMIGIWARVQLFVAKSMHYSSTEKMNALSSLAAQATSMRHSIVPGPYSNSTRRGKFDSRQQFMVIDAFYCLCHVALHSTIVPLFSGSPLDQQISAEDVRHSAQAVLYHAESFTSSLADCLGGELDVTYLPPVVGYGAFLTGSVLLAFEISYQDKDVRLQKHSRMSAVQSIITMLDTLCTYWKCLRRPEIFWKPVQSASAFAWRARREAGSAEPIGIGSDGTAYITSIDDEWWNMPFTSYGDFLGLDPVNLFRQGDDPFG